MFRRRTTRRFPRRRATVRRRRPTRRFTRFRRSRRFVRSTINHTKLNARVIPRSIQGKIPFTFTDTRTISSSSSTTLIAVGNGLMPIKATMSSNAPAPGDIWAAGVTEYAAFYDKYRVDASVINIQLTTSQGSGTGLLEYVFLATPVTVGDPAEQQAVLDLASYDDLKAWQYATWRTLGRENSSRAMSWTKKFRKTKNMLNYKDSRDQRTLLAEMPDTDGNGGAAWPFISSSPAGQNSEYIYYLRIFNNATTSLDIRINLKMIQYTTFQTLRFRTQTSVPDT